MGYHLFLITVLMSVLSLNLKGQKTDTIYYPPKCDKINQTDSLGNKIGLWVKLDGENNPYFYTYYEGGKVINHTYITRDGNKRDIFLANEDLPHFRNGGYKGLSEFIRTNMDRSKIKFDPRGSITFSFIVEPDGSISDIRIVSGMTICKACEEAVLNVLERMPSWDPLIIDNKAVPALVWSYFEFI